MDKIFKNRFENFEKKAPDDMLDKILEKAGGTSPISKQKPVLKTAVWVAAAIVALVVTVLSISNKKSDELNKKQVRFSAETKSSIKSSVKSNQTIFKANNKAKSSNEIIRENKANKPQIAHNSSSTPLESTQAKQKSIQAQASPKTKSLLQTAFHIIAPASTCNGECILKIDQNIEGGEWRANKSVFIQNKNNSKTLVRCSQQQKVLFTYIYQGQQDTFSVFFAQPVAISYTIKPEACGEENGLVSFNFPKSRSFVSTNTYALQGHSFEHLTANKYTFELQDNYACTYSYTLTVPQENLKGRITYDALETRVAYPIYFSANLDSNIEADYLWNFGDGQQSYEAKPEHKYKKAGNYTVSVEIIKQNCSETLVLDALAISDKQLEIPDIFTPNNDGKNDVFIVSAPENLISFEAIILNKQGHIIYKWNDPTKGWDGLQMNGQKAASGSYYYIIRGKDSTQKSFEYKSFLELRR